MARSCENLGLFYKRLGDYDKAIENFGRSYQIQKELTANDGGLPSPITVYRLAFCYQTLGDIKTAIKFNNEALKIERVAKNSGEILSTIFNNLGHCYMNLGDFKTAIKFLEQTLLIMKKSSVEGSQIVVTRTVIDIGKCYHKLENPEKAIQYFEEGSRLEKLSLIHI